MKVISVQTPCGPDMLIPAESDDLEPQASDAILTLPNQSKGSGLELIDKGTRTERNVNSSTAAKAQKYITGPWHGTTALLVKLPFELLVAIDSLACATYKADNKKSENEDYEGLMSQVEDKFVRIIQSIYVALVGNGDKCRKMVQFVREQMLNYMVRGGVPTIDDAAEAATYYFKERDPRGPEDIKCVVFICCWQPDKNRHKVIEVGDYNDTHEVKSNIFGAGAGSMKAVCELSELKIPIDAAVMEDMMIRTTLRVHPTGGFLKVFSLKNGTCELRSERILLNELNKDIYADILFDNKSMFVIILKEHEHILSREDLKNDLERFDADVLVFWLCVINELFLVYRVVFTSPSLCKKWSSSCKLFHGSVRRETCAKSKYVCHYYICDATREKLTFITRNMASNEFWKVNLRVAVADPGSSSVSVPAQ